MNKLQTIAAAMALLDKNGRLKQGSREYTFVRKMISDKIDKFGPDGALEHIRRDMTRILDQIR